MAERPPLPRGVAALLLAALLGAPAVAAQELAEPDGWDALLLRNDDRHGTLGPTGRRLFCAELEPALGFRGSFGYTQATPGFVDPLIVAITVNGREPDLVRERVVWRPSRLETTWTSAALAIRETKFITDDDVLVVRLVLESRAPEDLDLELMLRGRMTPLRERFRSRQVPVDLGSAGGPPADERARTLSLPPGALEYDSVGFRLPTPESAGGSTRGAAAVVTGAEVALPDVGRAVQTLHLLAAAPVDDRAASGDEPAAFLMRLDDGSLERVPWPARDASRDRPVTAPSPRVEWRALALAGVEAPLWKLAWRPPPGRFPRALGVEAGDDGVDPLLLAVTVEIPPADGPLPVLLGRPDFHGLPVSLALAGDGFTSATTPHGERALLARAVLAPGETLAVQAALACRPEPFPAALVALDHAERADTVERHTDVYTRWFDELVPTFACSDPLLERAWRERWLLVRRCLVRPDLPDFSLPFFVESLRGDGPAAVRARSAAAILAETRWLRSVEPTQGHLRALLKRQTEDGLVRDVWVGGRGAPFALPLGAAALGVYAVQGAEQPLREALPLLVRELDGLLAAYDADGDGLLAIADPALVGMEGLPSFDAEPGADPPLLETPLLAAGVYDAARALAEGARLVGDAPTAERLEALAARVRASALQHLWDAEQAAFRPVRASDHAPVRARELASLAPFAPAFGDGLAPDEPSFHRALDALGDPALFRTPVPLASVARSDPRFDPAPDEPPRWRGAAWPRGTTMALNALARGGRDAELAALLRSLAALQLADADLPRQAYDAETGVGAGFSDCLDAPFADLLVRFVGGVVPRTDGVVELRPRVRDLEHFAFRGLPYHGRRLDVTWDRPDGRRVYPDAPEGFTAALDGVLIFRADELRPAVVD